MKELILEIRSEEIPAGYVADALKSLEEIVSNSFKENRIGFEELQTYGTSRRLILHIKKVEEKQESLNKKVLGPPKAIAFDAQGAPTKAALGFAKNQGVDIEKLQIEKTERGEYLAFLHHEKGGATKKILSELIPKIITSIRFPKYMRWGTGEIKFVRPIHGIAAVFGGDVIPFNVGEIKSCKHSSGHRFLSPGKFEFNDFKSYKRKCTSKYVFIDAAERKDAILKASKKIASKLKGVIIQDDDLINTLIYMTEFPIPVLGTFSKEYLKLPEEALVAVMKKHQKYICVADAKGKLMPCFIGISDNKVSDTRMLRSGFERVLKARLADAKYFFDEDRKCKLEEHAEGLKSVVWQEQLGSLFEKVERIKKLAAIIAQKVEPALKESVERAAILCKADLMTLMVYEFPELQGIMGREYAKGEGEKKEVADAIFEHYLPRFSGDRLPEGTVGAILSLADKIDTITGCFAINLIPTGSEDPLALRRQSLGVMNTLIAKSWNLSIKELFLTSLSLYPDSIERINKNFYQDLFDFQKARLKNQFISQQYTHDVVDAVFSVSFDYITDDVRKINALSHLKKQPYFESMTTTFKRVCNIIGGKSYPVASETLFTEEAERLLYSKLKEIQKEVPVFIEKKDYETLFKKIVEIRENVDSFFEKVLVMAKEEDIKNNRLGLLFEVYGLFRDLADFSKIGSK